MEHLPFSVFFLLALSAGLVIYFSFQASGRSRALLAVMFALVALQALPLSVQLPVTALPAMLSLVLVLSLKRTRPFVERMSLSTLTLVHVVALPAELMFSMLAAHHLVPKAMTFGGYNFDILSGLGAPVVYYYAFKRKKIGRGGLVIWNLMSLLLVVNAAALAILSMPAIGVISPKQPNLALGNFPFNIVPGLILPAVLFSHLASLRLLFKAKKTGNMNFGGSVPEAYETYLGPFLMEPYAQDLANRLNAQQIDSVLELACGTGRLTRLLSERLGPSANLLATDISPEMLEFAKSKVTGRVQWAIADMANLPYADETFDLVVCQFGLMFATDSAAALREIRRVLKTGGRLIFNVWSDRSANTLFDTGLKVAGSFLGSDPAVEMNGPFSLASEGLTIGLLHQAGFNDFKTDAVSKTLQIDSAAEAAKGFLSGTPAAQRIRQRRAGLLPVIEKELIKQLTDRPQRSAMLARVYEVIK